MQRKIKPLLLATTCFLTPPFAGAASDPTKTEATPGTTAYDLVVVRPVGVVATVTGAALFVVGLPFSLISGQTESAAEQLIAKPGHYTFSRPIGEDLGGLGDDGR
jgi:hypothetical protein